MIVMNNLLDVDTFVTKSLNQPSTYFYYQLESLIDLPIQEVKTYLKEEDPFEQENALFQEASSLMKKLENNKIGLFEKLFGFESEQKKAHKQLLILQDDLQTTMTQLKQAHQKINESSNNIKNILNFLYRLKNKVNKREHSNEIDAKIVLLEGYELSLHLKLTNLLEKRKLYNLLLLKLL
jgi:hypothetical protein